MQIKLALLGLAALAALTLRVIGKVLQARIQYVFGYAFDTVFAHVLKGATLAMFQCAGKFGLGESLLQSGLGFSLSQAASAPGP